MSYCSGLQRSDETWKKRISSLQKDLEEKELDGWLIEDPLDLYYLTGLSLSLGELWVSKKEAMLLVDARYLEEAKSKCTIFAALTSLAEKQGFLSRNRICKIGFDSAKTSFENAQKLFKLEEGKISWKGIPGITQQVRKVKEEKELVLIRKSASLLWEGYLYIKSILREGISEREVAKKFEIFSLEKGADGLSFEPIIAFGENSAYPHYRAGNRTLKRGDVVLIDIGLRVEKYASDMTRTLFFQTADPFLSNWLDLVIEAEQSAIASAKVGTLVSDLDKAARSVFKQANVEPYFIHSLGHGIGLEVHEFPRIRFDVVGGSIEPGMVFTIEPGLYLPGKGGVRYEDMFIATETGLVNLFPVDRETL